MTVAIKPSYIVYTEDGVTTAFAAPFRYDATSLEVARLFADGSTVILTEGADYSATAAPTDAGGTVTPTIVSSGTELRIRRVTPRSQGTEYTTSGRFPAKSTENALDRAMMVDQEQDDAIDTTLRAPPGEALEPFPAAAQRAAKLAGFDDLGAPIAIDLPVGDASSAEIVQEALLRAAAVSAEATRRALGDAAEAALRLAGDADEATARAAEDAVLDGRLTTAEGEIVAAQAALAAGTVSALVEDRTYATKALLDADLAHDAGAFALVYADPTPSNNDLYVKTGASGAGSWGATGIFANAAQALVQAIADQVAADRALAEAAADRAQSVFVPIWPDQGGGWGVFDPDGYPVMHYRADGLTEPGYADHTPAVLADTRLYLMSSTSTIAIATPRGTIRGEAVDGTILRWVDEVTPGAPERRSFQIDGARAKLQGTAFTRVVLVLQTGQSLSMGTNASGVITGTPPYPGRALMPNGGVRVVQNCVTQLNTMTVNTTAGSASVVVASGSLNKGELVSGAGVPIATVKVGAQTGGTAVLDKAATATAAGVTLTKNPVLLADSQVAQLVDLYEVVDPTASSIGETQCGGTAVGLVPNLAANEVTVIATVGVGGANIDQIGVGSNPYLNMIRLAEKVAAWCKLQGVVLEIPCVVFDQGESNYPNDDQATVDLYITKLNALQAATEAALQVTLSTNGFPVPTRIPFLFWQPQSWCVYGNAVGSTHYNGNVPAAQIANAIANPDKFVPLGGQAMLGYGPDGLHWSMLSYRQGGERIGKAIDMLRKGLGHKAVYATAAAGSGVQVDLTYHAYSQLVVDTAAMTDPGQLGYHLFDSTGQEIFLAGNPSVVGLNTVRLVPASALVAGQTYTVKVAMQLFTGVRPAPYPAVAAGPTTGPRAPIRDSDTSVSSAAAGSVSEYNWAMTQKLSFVAT